MTQPVRYRRFCGRFCGFYKTPRSDILPLGRETRQFSSVKGAKYYYLRHIYSMAQLCFRLRAFVLATTKARSWNRAGPPCEYADIPSDQRQHLSRGLLRPSRFDEVFDYLLDQAGSLDRLISSLPLFMAFICYRPGNTSILLDIP